MTQTGPRSPEAKARVSTNAVRHGLRSTKVVIPGLELQADWDQFFADSMADLQPVGPIEYALADRIATLFWRMKRVDRAERDGAIAAGKVVEVEGGSLMTNLSRMLVEVRRDLGIGEEDPSDVPAWAHSPKPTRAPAVLPAPLELQNLSKYEYRLSRQLLHAMHELQALQDRRQGRDAPLARVDITGLPDIG